MQPNPYQTPRSDFEELVEEIDVIDPQQRRALGALVRRFLQDEVMAFEFDERLDEFRGSPDSVVRYVALAAWFHYDDCDDHLVALSKPEWDLFQRLLLLLESDRSLQVITSQRWRLAQLAALAGLLGYLTLVAALICNERHFLLAFAAAPFAPLSLYLYWRESHPKRDARQAAALYPFATFGELWSTRRTVSFQKAAYPKHLASRQIRSPAQAGLMWTWMLAGWTLASPIVLLFQMLPETETQTHVVGA